MNNGAGNGNGFGPGLKNSRIAPQGYGIQVVADVPKIHDEILQNLTM